MMGIISFIHILKCTNAKIRFIDQFSEHFIWNSIISSNGDVIPDERYLEEHKVCINLR